jgi:NADH-quinone oxidoreductase subunit G
MTDQPMSQWPSTWEYVLPVRPGPERVRITVDGREVEVDNGELLIKAAQEHGVYIPRFCWHDRMKPVGMCRMCLVEVEGMRGLQIACATPVYDGMVVDTQNDGVRKAQDGVLEFLLINHPLDCPVCDRGGECPLQDQTLSFGPGESRYVEEKRHFEKPIPISDLVLLDRERCIQCGRCTRFADEIVGDPLIDFGARGELTEVITYPGHPFTSYFSGNTV